MALIRFLLLPFLIGLAPVAATAAPDCRPPEEAAVAPERLGHLEARFTQTRHIPRLDRPLELSGRMVVRAGEGFDWLVREPIEAGYRFSPEGLTEVGAGGEVIRTLSTDEAPWVRVVAELFSAVLSGRGDKLERLFEVTTESDGDTVVMELHPRDEAFRDVVRRVRVERNPLPTRIVIEESGGGRSVIRIEIDCVRPEASA